MTRASIAILTGIFLVFALAAVFKPDAIAAFAGGPVHNVGDTR